MSGDYILERVQRTLARFDEQQITSGPGYRIVTVLSSLLEGAGLDEELAVGVRRDVELVMRLDVSTSRWFAERLLALLEEHA